MARHRQKYNRHLKGIKTDTTSTSTSLIDEFGIENCKIELIKNYPCFSRDKLLKREGEYIRKTDCRKDKGRMDRGTQRTV